MGSGAGTGGAAERGWGGADGDWPAGGFVRRFGRVRRDACCLGAPGRRGVRWWGGKLLFRQFWGWVQRRRAREGLNGQRTRRRRAGGTRKGRGAPVGLICDESCGADRASPFRGCSAQKLCLVY
eukprot:652758-Prorocentrum_minimum.AAC.2